MNNNLLKNIDMLHTTILGVSRIKRNLKIECDVVEYSKKLILNNKTYIYRKGKNWYCVNNNIEIVINAYTYTIITAKIKK